MTQKYFKIITLILILTFLKFDLLLAKKNKILFKLDNKILTTVDLNNELNYLVNINEDLKNSRKEIIYEIARKTLIRNKIKEIELSKTLTNYNIDEKVIINIMLKQFNANSEKELNEFLNKKKINKNFVLNKIKNEILWNELIVAKYLNKVEINLSEIKKDLQNKSVEKEYLLSEILFNIDDKENFEEKVASINNVISKKGFAEAALQFSISNSSEKGGQIGWIKESSLSKKIIEELKSIKKNKFSKPIVIPGGFLILMIDDSRVVKIDIDLDKAVKKVAQEKTQKLLEQYSTIYFNRVKKNLKINEL